MKLNAWKWKVWRPSRTRAKNLFFCALLIAALFLSAVPVPAQAQIQEVRVFVDGRRVMFDVPPAIEGGRVLVPMRKLFEAYQLPVAWRADRWIVVTLPNKDTLWFYPGSLTAWRRDAQSKADTPYQLDVPAKIVNGRTLVPLRFFIDRLAIPITWDDANRIVWFGGAGNPLAQHQTQDSPSRSPYPPARTEAEWLALERRVAPYVLRFTNRGAFAGSGWIGQPFCLFEDPSQGYCPSTTWGLVLVYTCRLTNTA